MNEDGRVVISNFGLTTGVKKGTKLFEFVGSPCWMAPEKIEQKDGYDLKSDIWSLGIIALELTSGHVPHEDLSPMKALMNIFNLEAPSLNKYEEWSPEFKKLILDCLQKDPQQRISINEVLYKHKKFLAKSEGN